MVNDLSLLWIKGQYETGFVTLEKAVKKKTMEEVGANGIAPQESSEFDQALEGIIDRIENAEHLKEAGCVEQQQEIEKETSEAV